MRFESGESSERGGPHIYQWVSRKCSGERWWRGAAKCQDEAEVVEAVFCDLPAGANEGGGSVGGEDGWEEGADVGWGGEEKGGGIGGVEGVHKAIVDPMRGGSGEKGGDGRGGEGPDGGSSKGGNYPGEVVLKDPKGGVRAREPVFVDIGDGQREGVGGGANT